MSLNDEKNKLEEEINLLRERRKSLYSTIEDFPKKKLGLEEEVRKLQIYKREIDGFIEGFDEIDTKKKLQAEIEELKDVKADLEKEYSAVLLKKNPLMVGELPQQKAELEEAVMTLESRKEEIENFIDGFEEAGTKDRLQGEVDELNKMKNGLEVEYSALLLKKNTLKKTKEVIESTIDGFDEVDVRNKLLDEINGLNDMKVNFERECSSLLLKKNTLAAEVN